MNPQIYNALAELLTYPGEGYAPRIPDALSALGNPQSTIGKELTAFAELTALMDLHEKQELFIQTFDLNPVCSLEMGWHLFGENYDRGLLLVKMREQLRAHGLAETTELPDHLTYGLRLLARMDRDAGRYFAEAIVLPALEKMLQAMGGHDNPYQHVLQAARRAIRADYSELPEPLAVPAGEPQLRVLA